jgi:hypothetical protein
MPGVAHARGAIEAVLVVVVVVIEGDPEIFDGQRHSP